MKSTKSIGLLLLGIWLLLYGVLNIFGGLIVGPLPQLGNIIGLLLSILAGAAGLLLIIGR